MEKHRLSKGVYLEFVKGNPDEDDVIRYADDYARTSPDSKVVMVSGGFDPVHVGHLRMFKEAKKLGDRLVVVLNSDEWLKRKKGKNFMHQDERAELIGELDPVDEVFILESERDDVGEAIEKFKPHIFANGGDRRDESDIPEAPICAEHNVEMIFNVGGDKVRSSSELLKEYHEEKNKKS
jgi:D-beta-D-heptose 7-phosphate kinase/D-beta-D-heptose 1-phosphate adenosyltransferase